LPLDEEQMTRLYEYEHGHGYIQEMFKELNAVERELLRLGYAQNAKPICLATAKLN
jgi:hypothetical protein